LNSLNSHVRSSVVLSLVVTHHRVGAEDVSLNAATIMVAVVVMAEAMAAEEDKIDSHTIN
jgi:hypothetical protein